MISAARRKIVYKAIRSAILKGQEVEYWAIRMYEQQEAGILTDAQVEELEALIEAYYDAHDTQDAGEPDGGELQE